MAKHRRRNRPARTGVTKQKSSPAPESSGVSPRKKTGRVPQKKVSHKSLRAKVEGLIRDFPPPVDRIPEFLTVCREVRAAIRRGEETDLAPEEAFYLTASGVETLAEEELQVLFDSEYRDRFRAIRAAHNLEEHEYWDFDDPNIPEEYLAVLEEFRREKRKILGKLFRKYGDSESADLVENDYPAYMERRDHGRRLLFDRDSLTGLTIPPEILEGTGQEQESAGTG